MLLTGPIRSSGELTFTMEQVDIRVTIQDVRVLYQATCDAIQYWPGSPARDPDEQTKLLQLKTFLFRILCEASYENDEEDSERR